MMELFIEWYPQIMGVLWTAMIISYLSFVRACLPLLLR
jgi:hypothetical protein